jgi:non-specific serine/threonine protein kinase
MRGGALVILGWARELRGESVIAMACYEAALALSQSHGESMYRMIALLSMGTAKWRHGEADDAIRLIRQSLELTKMVNDRRTAAYCLESLAWVAGDAGSPRIAAQLLGAAAGIANAVGSASVPFAHLSVHHDECEDRARRALGTDEFYAARQEGYALRFDDAVRLGLEAELDDGPETRRSDGDADSI